MGGRDCLDWGSTGVNSLLPTGLSHYCSYKEGQLALWSRGVGLLDCAKGPCGMKELVPFPLEEPLEALPLAAGGMVI